MTLKRVAMEFGMGTDLHGMDYTKAAVRALKDALWHNSLSMADAFGFPRDAMQVEVLIGVAQPDKVDKQESLPCSPTDRQRSLWNTAASISKRTMATPR